MSAPAIPVTLEEQVYEHSMNSMGSRWIADWLQRKHDVTCSHTAVLNCIRRVKEEKEAALAVSLDDAADPADSLQHILKTSRRIGRRAAQKGNMWAGIAALNVQLGVERVRDLRCRMASTNDRPLDDPFRRPRVRHQLGARG